jgi:hypothetical protein
MSKKGLFVMYRRTKPHQHSRVWDPEGISTVRVQSQYCRLNEWGFDIYKINNARTPSSIHWNWHSQGADQLQTDWGMKRGAGRMG